MASNPKKVLDPSKKDRQSQAIEPIQQEEPMAKANLSDLLEFHYDPSNRFMSHFIHFKGDLAWKETGKTIKKDGAELKETKPECVKGKLNYATVIEAESAVNSRNNLQNAIVTLYPSSFLDSMDAAGVTDYVSIHTWAKEQYEALKPKADEVKVKTPKAGKTSREISNLATLINTFSLSENNIIDGRPNLTGRYEELKKLINDDAKVKEAIAYLVTKMNDAEYGWVQNEKRPDGTPNPFYGQVKVRKS